MKTAYLDCFSGISGDMFLGSLLDAGLAFNELEQAVGGLRLEGCRLEARREARNHIYGTRFVVLVDPSAQRPKELHEIRDLISGSNLDAGVKAKSIEIFSILATAEGRIHNLPPEKVHFHEVGAVDSIVDIVGSVYGLTCLGIESLHASPLPLGSGFVETSHGRMPIPAPATLALLTDVPVSHCHLPFEMVTPTGAALVKSTVKTFGPMPPMAISTIGYGVGSRNLPDRPNLLRMIIGKPEGGYNVESVVILETNIDDMSPEWTGYLMERLLEAGAMDVIFCPVHMKKNRPGIQVQVMGRPDAKDQLSEILFQESGTLGIRFSYTQRQVLEREAMDIESPWGRVRAKKVIQTDGTAYVIPEYEVCRSIALKNGLSLKKVYAWFMALNADQ